MPDFADVDWRKMSQQERDLGLNNGTAVAGSVEMVSGWEQRSGEMRRRHSANLDLRYGPRERNRIDLFKAREKAPTLLFIHGGYWQNRAKEVFSIFTEGPMAHGINVALIGYTLAPDATLDEIVAEVHAGIDHLAGQLPALGAAAEGIVVSGWSAGGHLPPRWRCRTLMCVRAWRSQASTISNRSGTPISTKSSGSMKRCRAAIRR